MAQLTSLAFLFGMLALPFAHERKNRHCRRDPDARCSKRLTGSPRWFGAPSKRELQAGDFLFIDSSHRTFTNSGVTILFMNLLPRLCDGVVVHLHNIFWPLDFPHEWNDRYYSGQYLLGTYLHSGGAAQRVLLPNAFIVYDLALLDSCRTLLDIPGIRFPARTWPFAIVGSYFWMQTSEGSNGPAVV